MKNKYVITKEECEHNIKGVCEGCGGPLTAIETVDNARNPTFWQGCLKCNCFRAGVSPRYFKIARMLVDNGTIIPYRNMYRKPDHDDFWLDTQTAGLSHKIAYIDKLLKEYGENDDAR